ncbi:MAG: hypothetical protein ACI8RD_008436 [Bacillariaceae sp.]|jgi:hypothetical protein
MGNGKWELKIEAQGTAQQQLELKSISNKQTKKFNIPLRGKQRRRKCSSLRKDPVI